MFGNPLSLNEINRFYDLRHVSVTNMQNDKKYLFLFIYFFAVVFCGAKN